MSPYLISIGGMAEIDDPGRFYGTFVVPYIGGLRSVAWQGDYWFSTSEEGMPLFSLNRVLARSSIDRRPTGLLTMGIAEDALLMLIDAPLGQSVNFIVDSQGQIVTASEPYFADMSLACLLEAGGQNHQRLLMRELRYGWTLATLISMNEIQAYTRRIQFINDCREYPRL